MVCFTEHVFVFNKNQAQYWFQLLNKYYKDVEVTVNHDFQGKLSNEFLAHVPEADNYQVVTERFWDQLATLRVVPRFQGLQRDDTTELSPAGQMACKAILQIVASRLSFAGREIFLQSQFDITPTEFLAVLTKCNFDPEIVTHLVYNPEIPEAFLVLKNWHGILITTKKVCDSTLGVFDVDEGFTQNAFGNAYIPQDWAAQFRVWRDNLDASQGRSWDAPILTFTK